MLNIEKSTMARLLASVVILLSFVLIASFISNYIIYLIALVALVAVMFKFNNEIISYFYDFTLKNDNNINWALFTLIALVSLGFIIAFQLYFLLLIYIVLSAFILYNDRY